MGRMVAARMIQVGMFGTRFSKTVSRWKICLAESRQGYKRDEEMEVGGLSLAAVGIGRRRGEDQSWDENCLARDRDTTQSPDI